MPASSADLKTILVLDDDPQFHKLVVPVLTNRGHRVLSAHTGKEANAVLLDEHFDLMIVDGQLPDVTGLEWIAELRKAGHQALVMFVSAYWRDAASYHKLTKELAVSLVLHKPVMTSVFAAEVDILLGKSSAYNTSGQDSEIEDTLLSLRSEYAKELPARLNELGGLISEIRKHPDDKFLRGEAGAHSHKLRGTAASYGFKEIGDSSAEIEDTLIAAQALPSLTETVIAKIESAFARAQHFGEAAAEAVYVPPKRYHPLEPVGEDIDTIGAASAKILVVDDDAAFLDLVDEIARQHGLTVVRASNPAEALDQACMIEVDAALLDVELGSRDTAFKLAVDLRLLPGYGDLPLAFLSGAGHIEQSIDVEGMGSFLYMGKPMQSDALQSALRQVIAIRQAARYRVLVVDDDPEFLKRTAFVLNHEGMHTSVLPSTANILEEMQKFRPDLLLLDVMMPGVSGFDICRMLRTIARWRDLPIIFLTAYSDIDTCIASLKCGGDDYLTKPVINEELFTRLQVRIDRARQVKERVDRDNVTGLLTRRVFMEQLSALITEAKRQSWSAVVCFLQVVCPTGSRNIPDSDLAALGALLSKRLRSEDLKGCWNDALMIVAFRNEAIGYARNMLDKVAAEFADLQAVQEDRQTTLRIVYGVASYPYDGNSIHGILQQADRAMHGALTSGDVSPAGGK